MSEYMTKPKDTIYFYAPKLEDVEGGGWKRTITPLAAHPNVYTQHQFPPMSGQTPIVLADGRQLTRDRVQKAVCLGSPRKPLEPGVAPELDPDGVEQCKFIKLPNGQSLHDQTTEYDQYGVREWRFGLPIYVWEMLPKFRFNAFCPDWGDRLLKPLLKAMLAVEQSGGDPTMYGFVVVGRKEGRGRAFDITPRPLKGHIQIPDDDPRWTQVLQAVAPYLTREATIQDLGIAKFNQPPAQAASPVQQAPVFAGDDDPWGDDPSPSDGNASRLDMSANPFDGPEFAEDEEQV